MSNGKCLSGFQDIGCHNIFYINMDVKFTRKERLVASGHKNDPPTLITYSSIVSRDSIHITFFLAALNDLNMYSVNIDSAYLNAPCRENI